MLGIRLVFTEREGDTYGAIASHPSQHHGFTSDQGGRPLCEGDVVGHDGHQQPCADEDILDWSHRGC